MARPRTPTAILERRGAFQHDPARGMARSGEPENLDDISDPPAYIVGPALDCWCEIVSKSHEGVLSDADAIAVEMAAHLLAEFRTNPTKFAVSKIARLNALLSQFGMTPADRSRVKARSKEKKNKFAEMRNRGRPDLKAVS